MQMNRRGFLSSILALAAAPAIVRADALMRIVPRDVTVWAAMDFGHDDTTVLFTGQVGRYEGITFHEEPKWRVPGCLVTWDNHPLNPIFRL